MASRPSRERVEQALRQAQEQCRAEGSPLGPAQVIALRKKIQETVRDKDLPAAAANEAAAAIARGGARALFVAMIENSSALGAERERLRQKAAALLGGATAHLGFEVDGRPAARVHLGECPAGHDFGAELAKLLRALPEAEHPRAREQVSKLLGMLQHVYAGALAQEPAFVEEICGHHPEEARGQLGRLRLDPQNTTVFVGPPPAGWEPRAGVWVELPPYRPA